jgi:hypothetical protein
MYLVVVDHFPLMCYRTSTRWLSFLLYTCLLIANAREFAKAFQFYTILLAAQMHLIVSSFLTRALTKMPVFSVIIQELYTCSHIVFPLMSLEKL